MTELRLAAEIALRTLAVVAAAELAQRLLLRDARQVRRLWIAASFATALVALVAMVDWKPAVPAVVAAAPLRTLAAIDAGAVDAQPWAHPHYRRQSPPEAFLVYAGGVSAVALVVIASLLSLRRLRRASAPGSPAFDAIVEDLGGHCAIAIAAVDAPCTVGIARPVILMPRASERWPEGKLRAAIAHELAHVRQHDSLWMLFAWMLCAAMWFAPAAWIARRKLRAACELASDAAGAAAGGGAQAYARTLIEIAEGAARRTPLAANMAGSVSLDARIAWLMSPRRPAFRVAALLIALLLLGAFDWQVRLAPFDAAKPLFADVRSADPEARARGLFRLAGWQGHGGEVLPILVDALGDRVQPFRQRARSDAAQRGQADRRSSGARPRWPRSARASAAKPSGTRSDFFCHELLRDVTDRALQPVALLRLRPGRPHASRYRGGDGRAIRARHRRVAPDPAAPCANAARDRPRRRGGRQDRLDRRLRLVGRRRADADARG